MPSSTPYPQEIPYALDSDPRALWPTTSQQSAERIHDLTESYAATGVVVGWTVPTAGAVIPFSPALEPGQPWAYDAGTGTFTYSGPTRRFLVTLQAMASGGGGLISSVGLGATSGTPERVSNMSSGPGPDGLATHTHHLSMVLTMGPDNVTTLVASASANPSGGMDARLEVVSL